MFIDFSFFLAIKMCFFFESMVGRIYDNQILFRQFVEVRMLEYVYMYNIL